MDRREFLTGLAGGAAAVALSELAMGRGKSWEDRQVNVIYIMADDMGYADLGCYGQKRIKTPNIDKLAAEGTRFTQCYTGSTVCAPSRSVLMTGQHTGHTRVRGNSGIVGGVGSQKRVPLKAEDFTVAELFKKAGYVTGITGKWGLGEPETTGVPNRQGFDEWFGYLNQRNAHSYYPPYLWRNEERQLLEGNQNGKKEQYSHDLMTDFALGFLRRHKAEPFFLYLPYTVPHAKYEIPSTEPYTDESWPQNAKVHAAMITRLDGDVGKIMALLKDLGLDDNTLVFFCSDNGAAQRWEGIFDSSGPLRGRKRDMYEGGIRTPMIARWPGKIEAGSTNDHLSAFQDVLPTLAELAGVDPPAEVDGISMLPTLLGKPHQQNQHEYLYWEFTEQGGKRALRQGPWKIVQLKVSSPAPPDPELYNLSDDLGETQNVAGRHPEVVKRLTPLMDQAHQRSESYPLFAAERGDAKPKRD